MIIIDRGIRDGQVFFLSGTVSVWSIILVDYSREDWISIIISESGRNSQSIMSPSLCVARSNET